MARKLVVLAILMSSLWVVAQQKPVPATAEDVQRLVEVMRVRKQVETVQAAMIDQMKKGASAAFLQQYPNASPELVAKVEGVFSDVYRDVVSTEEYVNSIVPIYRKYLTHDDVQTMWPFTPRLPDSTSWTSRRR